jgi:isopenicillin N synthase-like dioxygenase
MTTALIPQINIAPLFAEDRPARAAVDAAIFAAAQEIGFLTI